eukprot:EG_transcript_5239
MARTADPQPVSFPKYMWLSGGYYTTTGTPQRLKNVIVVMDWVPDYTALALEDAPQAPEALTAAQTAVLRAAFDMFDLNEDGTIKAGELEGLLRAADIQLDAAGLQQLTSSVMHNTHPSGVTGEFVLTFEAFCRAVQHHLLYRMQRGRHYVALSLAEAEALRGALHIREEDSLLAGKHTAVGLHPLLAPESLLAGSSSLNGVAAAVAEFQAFTTWQCFRFFNAELWYTPKQVHFLLRALHHTPAPARAQWFARSKAARRRPITSPDETPLAQLFSDADAFRLLKERATQARIRTLLRAKGLWAADAFRLFDTRSNGVLAPIELYRGLRWLGLLRLTAQEVKDLYVLMDRDADGYLTVDEFAQYFGSGEPEGEALAPSPSAQAADLEGVEVPTEVSELLLEGEGEARPGLSLHVLARFDVKVKLWNRFVEVWNSKAISSRSPVSIWNPIDLEGYRFQLKGHKRRVSLGVYAAPGFQPPHLGRGPRPALVSFTDRHAGPFGISPDILTLLDRACPKPVRFHLVWAKRQGSRVLNVWAAVPPTDRHVALGMAATTGDEPPPLDCLRCVPRRWLVPAATAPVKVWDDSGSSGQAGSFWLVNNMQTLWVARGYDAPPGPFYDVQCNDSAGVLTVAQEDVEW